MHKTTTVYQSYPSRRTFLKASAAAISAPLILPKSVFGANEKLNIAWVGLGNMGWNDLRNCAGGNNVVALCDCNKKEWKKAQGDQYKDTKYFQDFREMLEKMGDKIDAVGVGTPDHTHFAITYAAMSMGKHVFVEKPLVHSLWEARTLQKLAVKKGVITQMGNQGHASEGARLIKEWYQAGVIGEVKEVITWTDRPAGGCGFSGNVQTEYPKACNVPADFDWNQWLGPVTKDIPYNTAMQPQRWRSWWDFGCGGLGDIGCHTIDSPYWAMDLGNPERVEVEMKDKPNMMFTPNGSIVTYKFPKRGDKPAVDLKWYEGRSMPEKPKGFEGQMKAHGGMIMVGSDGFIFHDDMRPDSPRLYPESKWQEYRSNKEKRVPKSLPRTKGIHRDWLNGIKTGTKSCSDFSYSAPLTEVIILGTLAIRSGQALNWSAKRQKIKGNDVAKSLIEIPVREGWRTKDLS